MTARGLRDTVHHPALPIISTPINLPAGFDGSIVYYNPPRNTEAFNNFFHNGSLNGANTGGGLIPFVGDSRYGGAGNIFPTNIDGSGGTSIVNYEVGTFAYQAAPEPASIAILGLVSVGLLATRRRNG